MITESKMDKNIIREFEDAGIVRRFLAYLIDVITIIGFPLLIALLTANELFIDIQRWISIPLLFIFYQTLCIYKVGQTIGGKIVGIRVVTINPNKVLWKVLLRGTCIGIASIPIYIGIGHLITLGICFSFIFFPPDKKHGKRRHLFDLLCGTCVIKASPRKESNICSSNNTDAEKPARDE